MQNAAHSLCAVRRTQIKAVGTHDEHVPETLRGGGAHIRALAHAQHTQRIRNNKLLLAVVWRRHALIDLEALKRGRATGGLVRHHTTDRAEENARRSTVVEWTVLAWVHKVALVHKLKVLQLSTC